MQNNMGISTFNMYLSPFLGSPVLEGKCSMTKDQRQVLNLMFVALKGGQIDVAVQLIPVLAKNHRFRPRHIDRDVWETKGRFISPQ